MFKAILNYIITTPCRQDLEYAECKKEIFEKEKYSKTNHIRRPFL